MKIEDAALGTPVTFTRHLHRRTGETSGPRYNILRKLWQVEAYPGEPDPAPRDGIVVGIRTLANGLVEYLGEDGTTFRQEETFRAFLISYSLHRRPVLVLPEHVTPHTVAPTEPVEADIFTTEATS